MNMVLKKELRRILNNYLKGNIRIKEKNMPKDVIEKKLFIESIILLREIEDRRDFMEEEIGMDMSLYEEKFLQVIENLFKVHFSKKQFELIQYYVYKVPTLNNWNGILTVASNKNTVDVKFETPEDVWNVLNSLK